MKKKGGLPFIVIILCLLFFEMEGLSQSIYGIKVSDSNNQFLGLLVDALPSLPSMSTSKGMTIYILGIDYPFWIDPEGNTAGSLLYYKGNYGACGGQPYVDEWRVIVKAINKYFIATGKGETTDTGEFWNEGTIGGGCVPAVSFGTTKYPAKEVTLPFSMPVSLPLKFVYDFPFYQSNLPIIRK